MHVEGRAWTRQVRTPWLKLLVLSAPLLVCHPYGKRLIFSLIFSLPLRCAPPKVPSIIEEEKHN